MYAADYRQRARLALRTRWAPAVLTALVASLLGAELFPLDLQIQLDPTQIQQLLLNPTLVPIFQGMVAWSLTLAIIGFFLGGVTHLGYCRFQLNLLDQKPAQLSDLFSQTAEQQIQDLRTALCLPLLNLRQIGHGADSFAQRFLRPIRHLPPLTDENPLQSTIHDGSLLFQ